MIFTETKLGGAFVIELEKLSDGRGFFARSWCKREFEHQGLNTDFVQCNISYNKTKGTLRGMHYQAAPHEEIKLVRCTRGAIYDVLIDLRPESPTYRKWISLELTADNWKMVYIPEGFAHGFQTLLDHTEVFYQMSAFYFPDAARGVRWDDPAFLVRWPVADRIISDRDKGFPDFVSP